jgi:hydrogenase expression/formation protein HypE
MNNFTSVMCPSPTGRDDRILLAHGEGGALMRRLLAECILPQLGMAGRTLQDAAVLAPISGRPVVTTDAFVVSPLFFPGGDIGTLAVYGTVNDLVVSGAQPICLTLSLILEEGLPIAVLNRVLQSVAQAARRCEVTIEAGDTKVVPRGAADGLFISTSGLGRLIEPGPAGSATLEPSDVLLVSGPIGQHGIAVLCAREELNFDPPPASDCGPLTELVQALRAAGVCPRAMRDATRGGVTAVLHEWARDCGHTCTIEEACLPVSPEVRGVCELLGLDPLSIANEGTMLVAVAAQDAERALGALTGSGRSSQAAKIGEVQRRRIAPAVIRRSTGREQPLIEPSGAPMPRIC